MDLLRSSSRFSINRFIHPHCSSTTLRNSSRFLTVRSTLPFPLQKAKYHRELQAAVDVVEKACRLCVDVKKSLFSSDGRILEKNDQTPVTVADFGVQALVSLELGRLFPSIPLVAEEDSAFIRSNLLADSVVNAVTDKASVGDKALTHDDVLEALDRGGKDAFAFGAKPATYWVLDPIDGTKGFLKGSEALYVVGCSSLIYSCDYDVWSSEAKKGQNCVGDYNICQKLVKLLITGCLKVGLALVVEGEIVSGVMGCPNWQEDIYNKSATGVKEHKTGLSGSGIIMVAHVGCGTWTKRLPDMLVSMATRSNGWSRCFVDGCRMVQEARFCISDSQTWESLPLSILFSSTTNADSVGVKQVLLIPTYCGSLCKYLMVASGRASVFILKARTQTVIKAWDHAVGMICIHEAGGKVTDWKGSQLDLAADQAERRLIFPSGGVLVTNGNLHNQILEMISAGSSVV
ncbi:hypothetical protein HHK36_003795 [Tetracentron sinense]|uniref:PAP-specific phosphatase, mitochondrial n=1 Tax=Tetracentron sinense TaxID=13715 RepID=A0A834ZU13_TETSI|nr:hypothetical protein HHK36_003795 [Tetracentron sinense]